MGFRIITVQDSESHGQIIFYYGIPLKNNVDFEFYPSPLTPPPPPFPPQKK